MADRAFVDVTYHGLEIGSQLELSEFGPTTAYLAHPTPLPVGTVLHIRVGDGVPIAATVLRVQEQVAGAGHSPGMRVRAELGGDPETWWSERITCEDPEIPEIHVAESPVPAQSDYGLHSDTEIAATMPVDPDDAGAQASAEPPADEAASAEPASAPDPEPDPAPEPQGRAKTVVMDALNQEELRAMSEKPKRRSTQVMSAQELSDITETAADGGEPKSDTDPGMGVGNGKPRKKKRRTRKKRPT
jgi:hypothetical protein